MTYEQLIAPNTGIPCRPGWCLAYVQQAFGAGWAGSTATDGWNRAKYRHTDQNFPNGVASILWFGLADEPAGHVVIRMGDGSIYSTSHPTRLTAYHHPNLQHLLDYYGGRLSYRGWSEDLNGTRVIKPKEDEVKPTEAQVVDLFNQHLAKNPDKNQVRHYTAQDIRVLQSDVLNASRPSKAEVEKAFATYLPGTSDPNRVPYYTNRSKAQMYMDITSALKQSGTTPPKPLEPVVPESVVINGVTYVKQ